MALHGEFCLRCLHAEALRRLPTQHSAFDSGNNTFTQVEQESLRHRDLPPSASLNVESDESRFGKAGNFLMEIPGQLAMEINTLDFV
jgi:hypothetical protein